MIPAFQPSLSVVVLENTITSAEPEQYVVIVHYFKYTSDLARGSVSIQDNNMSTGKSVCLENLQKLLNLGQ